MPRKKEDIMICTRHDYVVDLCDAASKILKGNRRLELEDRRILREQIRDIKEHTMKAKVSGQRMEIRLETYRNTIEALGFERKKK